MQITKAMPGKVLARHSVVQYDSDNYILSTDELTASIYPKLWGEFEVAVINEFSYKKRRTDMMIWLVQDYVDRNSAFLYPEGTVLRMPLSEIETERKSIASVGFLAAKLGEKKKTTMRVPTSLWSNFHVVVKRKFGIGVPVNDITLMLLSDYLERKKKFLSPSS